MRIVVYEFVTGGGWYWHADTSPPDSLAGEGRAMRDALAADLAAVKGTGVDLTCDTRYPAVEIPGVTVHPINNAAAEKRAIDRLASEADWTVLIAPEFDGQLVERTRAVEQVGGRLLGPSWQTVALCSDKQATAEHLARHAIPVPNGIALPLGAPLPVDFEYPAVLKPRDGAGSLGIEQLDRHPASRRVDSAARIEAFCPGMAVSVACLCGPGKVIPLEPCGQRLAEDFGYLGGWLPLDSSLADRARRLATRAVESLPDYLGYLGVDLILGDEPSGRGDLVIEINPRLTTSYVGLRAACEENLAATMIAVAEGRDIRLCWKSGVIHFTSSGSCVTSPVRGHS